MIKKTKDKLRHMGTVRKLALVPSYTAVFILTATMRGAIAAVRDGTAFRGTPMTFWSCAAHALKGPLGITATVLLSMLLFSLGFMLSCMLLPVNRVRALGEHGEKYLRHGTFGSARFMTPEEASGAFEMSQDVSGLGGFIYGRYPGPGGMAVASSRSDMGANKANIVFGSPGSGKSTCLIMTEIMQCLSRGCSFVATDPKGELFSGFSDLCRRSGWKVLVLNTKNPDYSDAWNCMEEVLDPETGMLDSDKLDAFVDTYMLNVRPGRREDFWSDGASCIMKALIAVRAFRYEKFMKDTLCASVREMYEAAGLMNEWRMLPPKYTDPASDGCHITEMEDFFRRTAGWIGMQPGYALDMLSAIRSSAPELSIGALYSDVLGFSDRISLIRREVQSGIIPPGHAASVNFRAWDVPGVDDSVKSSTVMNLSQNLSLIASGTRRRMLSHSGIDIRRISSEKTAVFIISDNKRSSAPVLSLFFSFLFSDCSEIWDETEARCLEEGTDPLSVLMPVSVIMDEFYSCGVVPGFPQFLSTARSRHIDVTIVCQNLTQLSGLYGDEGMNTILSCCEYIVYLRCNDPETTRFVSGFIGGDTTVLSQRRNMPGFGLVLPFSSFMAAEAARPLFTPDEIKRYKKGHILVAKADEAPLDLKKFHYTEHPLAPGLRRVSLRTALVPLTERFPDDTLSGSTDPDRYAASRSDSLAAQIGLAAEDILSGAGFFTSYCELEAEGDGEGQPGVPAEGMAPGAKPATGRRQDRPDTPGLPWLLADGRQTASGPEEPVKKKRGRPRKQPADTSELNDL